MPNLSTIRRALNWIGVIISLLIVASWAISLWFRAYCVLPGNYAVGINGGWLHILTSDGPVSGLHTVTTGLRRHPWAGFGFVPLGYGLKASTSTIAGPYYSSISLPHWLLLIIVIIPMAWLWHHSRPRTMTDVCSQCSYDLTGNVSGFCSECGLSITTPMIIDDKVK